MEVLLSLLLKLIPLYIVIGAGFLAGKYLRVSKESIAALLIYVINPVVIFNGAFFSELSASTLLIPFLIFIISSLICCSFYFIGKRIWSGTEKNILAFAAGFGNIGYFGLPVALILFGKESISLIVLCILGFILFEYTVGFYIIAKGNYSPEESLLKVFKLPAIYAFLLGISLNALNLRLDDSILSVINSFVGAFTVLGMMLIGLGLSGLKNFQVDFKFTLIAFFAKFVVWPLVILGMIFLDMNFLHLYSAYIYKVLLLVASVPMAANTVAFATELKTNPKKVAVAVLLSTLFALFFIPIISVLYLDN